MSKLYIIRGLPGSGKSTMAKMMLVNGVIKEYYEADMYFVKEGQYNFYPSKLHQAHKWCLNEVHAALLKGLDVAVANTFTTEKELRPYTTLGFDYEIIECTGDYGSIHNVPKETIERMKARWECAPN